MAFPAATSIQFFLGVGGQQTGPHTQSEILQKLKAGELPPDTLVWYEGLPDWQPIGSIEYLNPNNPMPTAAPAQAAGVMDNSTGGGFKPLSKDTVASPVKTAFKPSGQSKKKKSDASTFASGNDMEPVFGGGDGVAKFKLDGEKKKKLAMGGAAVVAILFMIYNFMGDSMPDVSSMIPQSAPAEPVAAETGYPKEREGILRKALSELLLKPEEAVGHLINVAKENSEDALGKEAVQAVVDYYKQRQRFNEAGKFLMESKRPLEAYKMFIMEPPAYADAEVALYAAYQRPDTTNKREVLVDDIKLLLGPVNNQTVAVERIKMLEADFPGKPHPFGYYLKTTDQKIADIFNRVSFYFVQNLVNYVASELPQMSLVKRPIVEVKKDRNGKYRVVGNYRGEVVLNQDRLPNIRFVFWLYNEQWAIIETNVTGERQRFSAAEKKKREKDLLSADEMLEYLQNVFRTQFPKNSIHENVTAAQLKAARANNIE